VPLPTVLEAVFVPKTVIVPERVRIKSNPAHKAWNVSLSHGGGFAGTFEAYVRVNTRLPESFSLGLVFRAPGVDTCVLVRVNGDHGAHKNPDGSSFKQGAHCHHPMPPDASKLVSAVTWAEGPPHADLLDPCPAPFSLSVAWTFLARVTGIVTDQNVDAMITRVQTAVGAQLTLP
jgi:hypothetical protein